MSLEQVYKHPGYVHFKAKDDMGLLKTKSDIVFTRMVRPLKLAKKQDLQGRLVSLAGKSQVFKFQGISILKLNCRFWFHRLSRIHLPKDFKSNAISCSK